MLDLKRIREDPGPARKALARRGADADLDELLRLDERRRELLPALEQGRARQNEASAEIATAKREGSDAEQTLAEMRELSARLKSMDGELAALERERDELAARMPNIPAPEAPDGETDEDAVVLREQGERPVFDFEVRDHLDLGTAAGTIEMEKAAEASGSRFAYLLGDLVLVELALVRYAVQLVGEEGFTPVIPPVLVREGPLVGTGYYKPPEGLGGDYKGATVGTSPAYSFGTSVCELSVDLETGKVKIDRFTDYHDCGTPINPQAVHGQVEGAIVMGAGETIMEDVQFDPKGQLRNPDLHGYLMMTIS